MAMNEEMSLKDKHSNYDLLNQCFTQAQKFIKILLKENYTLKQEIKSLRNLLNDARTR